MQLVLAYSTVPGSCKDGRFVNIDSPQSTALGWILLIFEVPMLIGCGINWGWLPELQEKGNPYSLEVLAEEQKEVRRSETAALS